MNESRTLNGSASTKGRAHDPSPRAADDRPHAVVIGAGFGGLAAAVRLGARGYRVTVIDKLDAPGGRGYVRKRQGFVFDSGPTVITAPFLFEDLWKLAHVPFGSWTSMAKIAPDMVALESYRTVYGLVSKFVEDDALRQVLSFHPLLVGGNPYSTTSIYTLIAFLERKWGVHFPMGGTGALVNGLVKLIEHQGGTVRLGTAVRRITVAPTNAKRQGVLSPRPRQNRATGVLLESGEHVAADVVVSNADSAWTYRHLVPEDARPSWTNRKIERLRYSMGLFVWYFGTKKVYSDVPHHSILLGPRYEGLLDDIFEKKVLATDMSLYLHRPTATDPSLAPEGCDTFYVLSPVPHLESGTDWSKEAEPYRARIQKVLEKTVLPNLGENIVVSEHIDPQYFQDELLSFRGAAFGVEPVLTQSAYFRPHNQSEDIENLFLVGAGTHPGAGLPGVLSSARVLDTVVPDASAFARKGAR